MRKCTVRNVVARMSLSFATTTMMSHCNLLTVVRKMSVRNLVLNCFIKSQIYPRKKYKVVRLMQCNIEDKTKLVVSWLH